jgi:2-polyprenyl-3-methyl-5-hydroxy-6-metoxy-1,4-benzoquinol methylase
MNSPKSNTEQENLWGHAKRVRFVVESVALHFPARLADSLRVLDVGCGNGSKLALPLLREGFHLTGIDTHAASIANARELARDLPFAEFVCGRVEDLSVEPFEVLILSEVLEHVAEPEALLRASLTHLRRDGLVIVTVPNGYGEFEWDSWLFDLLGGPRGVRALKETLKIDDKFSGQASTDNDESKHIQFFTLARLYRLFDDCSLTVLRANAASFASGPFVNYSLGRSQRFVEWNARVADKLPLRMNSGWYFALCRKGGE